MTSLSKLAVRLIPCAYCLAPPGRFCRVAHGSTVGARASYIHVARTTPVYEAWTAGYVDGLKDALDRVRRHIERGRDIDTLEADLEQSIRR